MENWRPEITVLTCQYCGNVPVEMAGAHRITYPATVKVETLPCTGRMDLLYLVKALEHGADGVIVAGCMEGDCHYQQGNFNAKRRVNYVQSLIRQIGLEPERVRMFNMSSAMGQQWAEALTETDAVVRKLGPSPLKRKPPAGGHDSPAGQ